MALIAVYHWDDPNDIEDGYIEWVLEFEDGAILVGFNEQGRDDDAWEKVAGEGFWKQQPWQKVWP